MTTATTSPDGLGGAAMGRRPENRRQWIVKILWTGIWLVYLSAPVTDLLDGGHGVLARVLGSIGLAVFVVWYLLLVFRTGRSERNGLALGSLACLAAESAALALGLGREWLVLFVYVAIASGAALPVRLARWTIPAASALMAGLALVVPDGRAFLGALLVPALLGGFAMTGVRELVRTTIALREARATVARLAANEERLRLARDLHDLLGHSLSLITLKSELAGRMLPDQPEQAARQVADIEQVSRQALVDVREAVAGYRRPRLADELAGARLALAAAEVAAELPGEPDLTGIPEDIETALAWALREAVTNVVRHSGARRCTVELLRRRTPGGQVLELSVEDDGTGGSGEGHGNGLTGLAERLHTAGGTLEAGPCGSGFRLVARVPAGARADVGSPA
ncbi:sensor histidine kinase [Streptomyces sp. SBST2-5]|uniref:Sensor histidine kinase n=1 Tax=Streptomyces composti TaxID=2720025 RepID=A0ABX1A894_9ACTN|nr:histidine kinase [Streptomyces composti]NJP50829.1 sensor histidine kinase [Streptomyces composti]